MHTAVSCRAQVSATFNAPVVTLSDDGVSFSSSGLVCGTACTTQERAQAQGEVIYLMRASLAVRAGIAAGTYDGESLFLHPYAFEVLNFGGGFIHDKLIINKPKPISTCTCQRHPRCFQSS